MTTKARLYRLLESSLATDRPARVLDIFLVILILANVGAVVLETVHDLAEAYGPIFHAFDLFSVEIFTIEYGLRVWACTETRIPGKQHPLYGRLRYMASPLALIDLLAILPFYLGALVPIDLRFMRVLRILRLLKLTRYSPAIETLLIVIWNQRRPLLAATVIFLIVFVFTSALAYLLEHEAQPDKFASIPHAMWWAMATLATVGFGDVTPVTPGGKLLGSIMMMIGIASVALPTGILANGFAEEIRKRNFVVTWRLVASVPLFAHLDALAISEIADMLKPKLVPARHAVVIRGETADAVYFIASGEAEVHAPSARHRLGAGDFFGEISLLNSSTRSATVTSRSECHLLVLSADNFHRLLAARPEIKDQLMRTMRDRLAQLERAQASQAHGPRLPDTAFPGQL